MDAQRTISSADQVEAFNRHRSLLFAIAYRMLGSVMDAEDMVQESFIRWQSHSKPEIESSKAYLTTIVTRLCIDRLRSARVQRETYVGTWLPEPIVANRADDPNTTAELADTLTVACLVLLESLSPIERAVYVLREAFGYDYAEIARMVDKSAVNCRQIGRRARQHVAKRRPRFQSTPHQQERLTQQFLRACKLGDVEGLLNLFAEDITLWSDGGGKVVACLTPLHGALKVARFLKAVNHRNQKLGLSFDTQLVQVNGRPGILFYQGDTIETVVSIDSDNQRIKSLYYMRNPDKLRRSLVRDVPTVSSRSIS